MGFVGTALVFAPAIGPTLSGWIIQTHSWRMLFFIVLPIAFLAIIVGAFLLENVTEQSFPKIDVLAIIFSTLGFGGLLYGVSSAGDFGWFSPDVLVTLTVGIIALWLFIRRQMTAENPMLDLSVFKFNMYTLTSIISVIVTMAMFAGMVIVPIYMQTARDFTPIESGFLLFPGAIAMGIMSPINGWIFDKIGAKWLAIVGLTITAITTWELSGLTSSTSYTFLLILYTFRMFGMSMLMMPIMTAGLNQLPETLYSHGVAVSNTLRVISGALGTAFLVTVMTTRTEKYVQELTITAGADAQSKMSTIVSQASIQGINDAFTIATVLALLSLLLAFFIKHVEPAEE